MLFVLKPNDEDPGFRLRRKNQQERALDQACPTKERDEDRQHTSRPNIVDENDCQSGGESQDTGHEKKRPVLNDCLHNLYGRLRVHEHG